MALNGRNISLPIYHDVDGIRMPFHNLVLHKFTVDSVVMSLGDKITGDVYYIDSNLEFSMQEYVLFNGIKYSLVNPPTLVREGLVKENSDLKGMSKYSFEFYHPMYMLSNFPFTDVAVSFDELRYKSQDKTFSWIGKPQDFVNKLNKNLENTEWVVVLSSSTPQDIKNTLSDVISFDNSTIADALKVGYETWGLPYVVDKLNEDELYDDGTGELVNYYDFPYSKKFIVVFGLPANEIYQTEIDKQLGNPFVFRFGQGVGLKNNSRTPRNNKIVTRIAGYGSENNIPYGYPQIRWYGNQDWDYTINNESGMQTITVDGKTFTAMSYPIYKGIVGGEWVKLIKHPFTRKHLMPSIYAKSVFNKVSQFALDANNEVVSNSNFNPDIEIIDYYDASQDDVDHNYVNLINLSSPSYEIHEFDDIKPELGEAYILGATPINARLEDVDEWDDTMDDNGNYLQSYFRIHLPKLEFDIYACAAITQEMQINMRSGACIGCTFTVQVDWEDYKKNFYDIDMNFAPNGEQRDLSKYPNSKNSSITVVVQKDINTFGTLMPNIYQYPAAGDAFVVLGISLPLEYITSAQRRLDDAMKSYMLENNIYYFDYPLKFDEFMLANNTVILNQIRPNSIIRFNFNDETLELFVKQLTIKFNDSTLPQYDITLTDNIEVVLNQIGQVADDVEHLSALISLLRQQYGKNVLIELGKKLSKVDDDTASGLITFAKGWQTLGFISSNFLGYGANVDQRGVGEFEEINIRGALRASELVFNRISAEEGEAIRSIGHGEILTVDEETMTATLKLDGDEWATIDVGDICRGLYNTINKDYDNANNDGLQDDNGFRMKSGFFASYFKVEEILSNGKGECTFRYSLQPNTTEHPCELMKFAVYGNTNDSKKERQSCMYITAVGIAPRLLFLSNVNDWQIKPQNIKIAQGNIDGLQVYELQNNVPTLKTLHGDAGLFVEDNIYFGGILNQFTSADWEYIQQHLGQGISAQLLRGSDNIVVDILGNIVGGIYEQYGEDSTGNRHYRLHTGILVYDSGKKRYLSAAEDESNIGEDEYAIYYTCDGCEVIRDGADFYVTAIHNTNDGISGTTLTDEQLALMRMTDECRINFVIVTHSGWRTMMSYPIRITHLDHAYITFDLDNEFDSIAYRTQIKRYDLGTSAVRTGIHAYINGNELVDQFVSVSMESDLFTGTKTVGGNINQFTALLSNSGLAATIYKSGRLVIDHTSQVNETDLTDAKHYFDISATVRYAGVDYESGKKRFILQENTDATLYKLLLSANAISKDEGTYTPSSIDVKVQIIDNNGSHVYTEAELESSGNIKVRYLNGTYDPNISAATLTNSWLTPSNKPDFSDVVSCFTVLVVDITDGVPLVLDVESVTINAIGRDGAGQPWVKLGTSQVFIDCDDTGHVKATTPITITAMLYWGDNKCTLDNSACAISQPNEDDDTPIYDSQTNPTVASKTYVFNQGDFLESINISVYLSGTYDTDTHSASDVVSIVANVQGQKGDKGDAGASLRYRKDWLSGVYYVWDSIFRDVVKHESSYWFVNKPSDGTILLGEPGESDDWVEVNNLQFVATELLLSENGTIDLLSSQVLRMFNSRSQLTATLNEDGNGSYVIYDGDTGLPMMNYCYDGYIYRYKPDGSVAWRIGLGGEIEKNFTDSWNEFRLVKINNYPTGTQVTSETTFSGHVTYYQFRSGSSGNWSEYTQMIFITQSPANPAIQVERGNVIPDGWYTPNFVSEQSSETVGETSYVINVLHIINGRIENSLEVTEY